MTFVDTQAAKVLAVRTARELALHRWRESPPVYLLRVRLTT